MTSRSRRRFLFSSGIASIGILFTWWHANSGNRTAVQTGANTSAAGSDLRHLGRAYFRQQNIALRPDNVFVKSLNSERQLITAMTLNSDNTDPTAALLKAHQPRIKNDYLQGATCELDGWILSETEIRLACASYLNWIGLQSTLTVSHAS